MNRIIVVGSGMGDALGLGEVLDRALRADTYGKERDVRVQVADEDFILNLKSCLESDKGFDAFKGMYGEEVADSLKDFVDNAEAKKELIDLLSRGEYGEVELDDDEAEAEDDGCLEEYLFQKYAMGLSQEEVDFFFDMAEVLEEMGYKRSPYGQELDPMEEWYLGLCAKAGGFELNRGKVFELKDMGLGDEDILRIMKVFSK